MRPSRSTVVRYVLSFGLLGWFLFRTDLTQVWQSILRVPVPICVLIFIISNVGLYINTIKWQKLVENHSTWELFLLNCLTRFYHLILPGQVSGEIVKAYMLAKGRPEAERITASIVIDKAVGLFALLLVGLVGVIAGVNSQKIDYILVIFGAVLALIAVGVVLIGVIGISSSGNRLISGISIGFARAESLKRRLAKFDSAWRYYTARPLLLLETVAIGMASQFILAGIPYLIGTSMGIDLSYWDWCWIFVIVFLVVFVPISVSGIGVREVTFVALLGLFGYSSREALALSFTMLGLHIINGILGRAVYPIFHRARLAEE